MVNKGVFPDELKHENEKKWKKENYRTVSILPNLSKIFEHCMHDQLNDYFDKILLKCYCGFRHDRKTY